MVPTFVPLTFHWYEGVVPPLVGEAVNVTELPAQTGLDAAAIDTDAGKTVFTVIKRELDVAGDPVTQELFDVITQVTASPFTGL